MKKKRSIRIELRKYYYYYSQLQWALHFGASEYDIDVGVNMGRTKHICSFARVVCCGHGDFELLLVPASRAEVNWEEF